MPVDTLVVHPTAYALAVSPGGSAVVQGAVCRKPKITTGAGDHFNAGFCLGRIRGLALAESLQTGVATSGYFVRSGQSPALGTLVRFLRSL